MAVRSGGASQTRAWTSAACTATRSTSMVASFVVQPRYTRSHRRGRKSRVRREARGSVGAMRLDVGSIDRTQFKVVEEEGETLIIPLKDKYRWRDDELHLRSLVLDATGTVISAGFPKFFNFGEQPERDRELAAAMARGGVEFPEKLDGSLIVADRVGGVPRLRTRGRRLLGEFGPEVDALID